MKNRIAILLLLAVINIFPAVSGDIETRDMKLFREGGNVVLSFAAYIPEKTVRTNYRLLVTPQLYNDNGAALMELFTITGNQMEKREKQKRRLNKNRAEDNPANTSNGSTMLYTASVPYEAWMESALSMRLLIKEEGCCSIDDKEAMVVTGLMSLPLPYAPYLSELIVLPSEATNKRADFPFLRLVDGDDSPGERNISVRFRSASSIVDLSFSSNAENINKIMEGVRLISSDPKANLEKITIVGFASPEGSNLLSIRLSTERARALSLHLQKEMNTPRASFEIQSGGVDWAGLLELVNQSDMNYKEEIMHIITNTPPEKRNDQLKQLGGGRPYQSIYDVIYPQLRDACYINVWYSEVKDEAVETINNAITLIAASNYEEALESLLTVGNDSRSWNAIGTCYLLQGDYSNARAWLRRAMEAGDKEAERNMDLVK